MLCQTVYVNIKTGVPEVSIVNKEAYPITL